MGKRKLNEAYADIDIALDYNESLEEVFDYYSYTYPELTFEVLTMESIFTGWPEVRVSGNRKNLMLFLLDYFAGEDEEFISNFIEESKNLTENKRKRYKVVVGYHEYLIYDGKTFIGSINGPEIDDEIVELADAAIGEVWTTGSQKFADWYVNDYLELDEVYFTLGESKKLNEEFMVGTEIYDGSSLQDYAYANAWSGARDRLEDIDAYEDGWDYLFELLDDTEEVMSETYLNDFLWFDALDILEAHFGSDEDRLYTYLFPALTEEDREELDNYDLEVFATHENGAVEVLGTKRDLKHYASEYLDYVLVEGYLEEY